MKLNQIYRPSLSLLTDLYQLTMAYGYWKTGAADKEAVFHLFFRKPAFKGNYTIACGLQYAIDYIRDFHFSEADIAYLATLKGNDNSPLFEEGFLDYLRDFKITADIDAMEEGTIVFPHQPLIRVKGRLIEGQLLETALLNILNFQTLIATKAARVCEAAKDDAVLEFGLRRAQGIDGALAASRAAYIGGCTATSNVLAGRLFGIPVKGTHAHSWVMCHDTELAAFENYAKVMPNNAIFLVDTYDTMEGVENAIVVGKKLKAQGYQMAGIRLDSGDMGALSIEARKLLDAAGFPNAMIAASNDLDEHKITQLKQQGAVINIWGVGTNLVTAKDQPALGGVYKLAAIKSANKDWQYCIKLSEQPIKISNPGLLQIRRFSSNNYFIGDVMYNELAHKNPSKTIVDNNAKANAEASVIDTAADNNGVNLLIPIFRNGEQVYQSPAIELMRQKTKAQLQQLQQNKPYAYGLSQELYQLKQQLIREKTINIQNVNNHSTNNPPNNLTMKKALILVDIQNDFLPGGALAVPEGDAVIPIANQLQAQGIFDLVLATQDWHPANHGSFAANKEGAKVGELLELNGLPQVMWPVHCVQKTKGAELAEALEKKHIQKIIYKGTDATIDSYSGFFDNGHRKATGMGDYLKAQGITNVYVMGLATDYCVKFTALDAHELGFNTFLIADGSRGVNLQTGDVDQAITEMKMAGVSIIQHSDLLMAQ